jgi:uncharacterized protein YbjT (DUF2867 family)
MRIAVAGAGGFVGRALVAQLVEEGHEVVALGRRAPEIAGVIPRAVDVGDTPLLVDALAGCEAAYYLVHSLDVPDFRERDRKLAESFGRASRDAGITRIVYLGALGEQPTSDHLASRQEVGTALGEAGVPVVELRAAVILGAGSISFEMLRYLTERLPFMVCPRWVHTAIQPIALVDVVDYLARSLSVAPAVYEIGGSEVTSYREMIGAYAQARGLWARRILDVPLLTPRLSSYWVDLVTPVDHHVSHALIESLITEVVVHDARSTYEVFGIEPLGVVDAIRRALDDQARALDDDLLERTSGLQEGVYAERVMIAVSEDIADAVGVDLGRIGGDIAWYGATRLWRARIASGRLVGERWRLQRPEMLAAGVGVDWWTVVTSDPSTLILRGNGWSPGDAWIGYRVADRELVQVGALRTKGVVGFLYWKALAPIHHVVFARLARHRISRAALAPNK